MVSDCAFWKVVRSDSKFCVVDDQLAAEFPDGRLISVAFIERCFCDTMDGVIIHKK